MKIDKKEKMEGKGGGGGVRKEVAEWVEAVAPRT